MGSGNVSQIEDTKRVGGVAKKNDAWRHLFA